MGNPDVRRDFEALEWRRMEAAGLLEQGVSQSEVARRLGVHRQSVIRWARRLAQAGWAGLMKAERAGRKPRLSSAQVLQLVEGLERGLQDLGYTTGRLTASRLRHLIASRTGVTYHPAHIWRLFRQFGWSYQRPTGKPRERDGEGRRYRKRVRFIAEYRKDLNATKAAIRAGYSRRTAASQGQRLLKSPVVGRAIAEAQAGRHKGAEGLVERIIKEAAVVAFADPGESLDEHGLPRSFRKRPKGARPAPFELQVKELSRTERGGQRYIIRRYQVKFPGKLAALKLLGKHLNMFPRKSKQTKPSNPRGLSPESVILQPEESVRRQPDPWAGIITLPEPPKPARKSPSRTGQKGRGSSRRGLFAVEYLKDFNATLAAMRAGYSPKTAASQGQRLLNSAAVKRLIAEAHARLFEKVKVSVERVRAEYWAIALADIGQFVDERWRLRPISRVPEEARCALSELVIEERYDRNKKKHRWRLCELKLQSKRAALDALANHQRLLEQDKPPRVPQWVLDKLLAAAEEDEAAKAQRAQSDDGPLSTEQAIRDPEVASPAPSGAESATRTAAAAQDFSSPRDPRVAALEREQPGSGQRNTKPGLGGAPHESLAEALAVNWTVRRGTWSNWRGGW